MNDDQIVLLNQAGTAIAAAPKTASHHRNTPYHLAFSCYLVNGAGEVLITRRSLAKATFPGVWTNSCCGHPAPGEGLRQAVRRRLAAELGVAAGELALILPAFSYRAAMDNGVVEHELCPVVRARVAGGPPLGSLRPDPAEVAATEWRTWQQCLDLVRQPTSSPWYRWQMALLATLGPPLEWRPADPRLLPPAVRW